MADSTKNAPIHAGSTRSSAPRIRSAASVPEAPARPAGRGVVVILRRPSALSWRPSRVGSTPAAGAERVYGASGRSPRGSAAIPALVTLLLAGLALRLTIAYVLFPGSGFATDISSFVSWALTLADVGPGIFYASAGFADYPPGYLYVLWLVGLVANALAPLAAGDAGAVATTLIKLPPMLADVVVAFVLYRLVRGWAADGAAGGREATGARAHRLGLVAAAIYLFNPVTWYDSALWGQTDAVGALVMLLGVAFLVRDRPEAAAVAAVLAGLVKPQFGVVLGPLVAA